MGSMVQLLPVRRGNRAHSERSLAGIPEGAGTPLWSWCRARKPDAGTGREGGKSPFWLRIQPAHGWPVRNSYCIEKPLNHSPTVSWGASPDLQKKKLRKEGGRSFTSFFRSLLVLLGPKQTF
jgi:hypothetical protein